MALKATLKKSSILRRNTQPILEVNNSIVAWQHCEYLGQADEEVRGDVGPCDRAVRVAPGDPHHHRRPKGEHNLLGAQPQVPHDPRAASSVACCGGTLLMTSATASAASPAARMAAAPPPGVWRACGRWSPPRQPWWFRWSPATGRRERAGGLGFR